MVEEGQLKVSNRGSTQGRRLLGSHIDLVRKGVIYSYTYTASRCMKIDGQQSFSRSKYLPKRKRQMSSIFISVHCSVPTSNSMYHVGGPFQICFTQHFPLRAKKRIVRLNMKV